VRITTGIQVPLLLKPAIWGKVMGLSGLPSLLALLGLVGLALMEAMLAL